MPETKLEYNLAGGLLMTLREKDLKNLIKDLVESNFNYGCVLPFRALAKEQGINNLKNSSLNIVHIEEAWNPADEDNLFKAVLVGLLGHAKRLFGDKTEPPILQDTFFPSKTTCNQLFEKLLTEFPESKFISHHIKTDFPKDHLLLEISPMLNMSPAEILEQSEKNDIKLVFDPSHLITPKTSISLPNEVTKPKNDWENQFNFFKEKLEVVDINPPTKQDLKDLLNGKGLLKELAQAAKETPKINFLRVELVLPIKSQFPSSPFKQQRQDFLKNIQEILIGN